MKVGGNESATKFFQRNGGSAALASKDPKTKYTSNAATKYKEELSRRAATDAKQYPEEVVITDIPESAVASSDGTNTPAAEGEDDFFSSWDKPTIKRPSNPPSRTGTPSQGGRTASPFLKPGEQNGNGPARPKSPLSASDTSAPSATRTTSSSAIRKSTPSSTAGPKKANILGAKKKGLGAKKVDASALDFDEAEKKAKEEADRIEKLGYNPNDETEAATSASPTSAATESKVFSPTPVSPRASLTAPKGRERSSSEMERLGMGVARLGFGQMGAAKPAEKKPAARAMGFGSTGSRAAAEEGDGEKYAREKFGTQKGISSDEFFGRGNFDSNTQAEAKGRLQGFEGATSISSNAYFGRPEDEIPEGGDYGDLEGAARDFVRRFGLTAGDDLENIMGLVGEGGRKLQGAVRSYLNS